MIGKNFIHKDMTKRDREVFFDDEPVEKFDDSWTMADITVATGMFPSKNQARKNGFNTPIPPGFSERKKKHPFWILNKGTVK